MKKIPLYIILGVLLGSLMTYLILNTQPRTVDKTSERWDVVKIQEKKIRDLEKQLETQNTSLKQKDLKLLKLTSKELQTFKNDELGFSFSYPAWFGKLDFSIRNGDDSGKIFHGEFQNVTLEFGGTTKNFGEGRETWPTDYNGNQTQPEKVLKTLPISGGIATIIRGSGEAAPGNWFSEGTYGAFIKLNGKEFQGLAFLVNAEPKKISLDELESVLKTLMIK